MEFGVKFVQDKEIMAHEELDILVVGLNGYRQDGNRFEVKEDNAGILDVTGAGSCNEDGGDNLCNREAYFGGGKCLLNRWLPKVSNVKEGPVGVVGHGENMAINTLFARKISIIGLSIQPPLLTTSVQDI